MADTDSSFLSKGSVAPLYKKVAEILGGNDGKTNAAPLRAATMDAAMPGFVPPRELEGHARYLVLAPLGAGAVPTDASDYQIVGGSIEGSNVDPVRTMVAMIEMFRSYEGAQRAIQSADETERRANDIGRV